MDELYKYWTNLCSKYSSNPQVIDQWFDKLLKAYNETQRHYHNMEHVASMLSEIDKYKITEPDLSVLLFSTWFHDAVYDPHKKDNEAKSAQLADEGLTQLLVPPEIISKVKHFIIATANHMNKNFDSEPDLSFFLDCDLKILGTDKQNYIRYTEQIRKEYHHVPSLIYSFERKRVLKRFINAPSIYRTEYFKDRFEQQARTNILNEIQSL